MGKRDRLYTAAQHGDLNGIRAALEPGFLGLDRVKVDATDDIGRTALMAAARAGQEAAVRLLLDLGADINARDRDDVTALFYAALGGHTDVVSALTSAGADVRATSKDGLTALWHAAAHGHAESVLALASAGANPNAAYAKRQSTALMEAAYGGHTAAVRALIAVGADVHAKDDEGATALIIAVQNKRADVVRALLGAGAEAEAKDGAGRTAADYARGPDQSEIYGLLRPNAPRAHPSNALAPVGGGAAMGRISKGRVFDADISQAERVEGRAGRCPTCGRLVELREALELVADWDSQYAHYYYCPECGLPLTRTGSAFYRGQLQGADGDAIIDVVEY